MNLKQRKLFHPTHRCKERDESSSTRYQPRRKGANLKKGGSCKFAEATMAVQFPPRRARCTRGGGCWWSPSRPPIPSSPRPPRRGCSTPALAAPVSSMPPSGEDEKTAFFKFLCKSKNIISENFISNSYYSKLLWFIQILTTSPYFWSSFEK